MSTNATAAEGTAAAAAIEEDSQEEVVSLGESNISVGGSGGCSNPCNLERASAAVCDKGGGVFAKDVGV